MFYDVDILNPRGGKFGIIWLAAHKKLRLKSRTDFQLMLKVNIAQTW
jgi:meiotic recombination protein REC8, animal type